MLPHTLTQDTLSHPVELNPQQSDCGNLTAHIILVYLMQLCQVEMLLISYGITK